MGGEKHMIIYVTYQQNRFPNQHGSRECSTVTEKANGFLWETRKEGCVKPGYAIQWVIDSGWNCSRQGRGGGTGTEVEEGQHEEARRKRRETGGGPDL
jgi:hypothetical protein